MSTVIPTQAGAGDTMAGGAATADGALRARLPALIPAALLALGLAVIGAYLLRRYLGAYPAVFADEYIYSRLARLIPLGEVSIPSYLYLSLFGATSACGTGFLDCARQLNVLFFLAAAPFVYATARLVCARPAALLLALLCALAPAKIYSAYFMPESMYFFGFSVLAWFALAQRARDWRWHALGSGALLGAMTLIKVHALFLIPALALFMVYCAWQRQGRGAGGWLRTALAAAALCIGAVLVVKFGLGYLFGRDNGLHLLGSFYGTQASFTANEAHSLAKLAAASLLSLKGHLMMLAIVFALPLAAILRFLMRPMAALRDDEPQAALILFSLLMLGTAMALSIVYTATIAEWGPREGERLHVRYYNFCFALLLMVGVARAHLDWRLVREPRAWIAAALVGMLLLYAQARIATDYRLLLVDAPEIAAFGLDVPGSLGTVLVALQAFALLVWALNGRLGALVLLAVVTPLYIYSGEQIVKPDLKRARVANDFDRAGQFAHQYLTPAQRNEVTIAGTNLGELQRAKFHLDAPDADLLNIPLDSALEQYQLPGRKQYLLVVGNHRLPADVQPLVKTDQYALVKTSAGNRTLGFAHMAEGLSGPLLSGVDGLSSAEPWGRWSDSKQVRLHLRQPLPRRANLFLRVRAFGPNAELGYVLTAGPIRKHFRIPLHEEEIHFALDTDGTVRTITIDIAQPTTPKALGWSEDMREIGIGLTRVEIGVPLD